MANRIAAPHAAGAPPCPDAFLRSLGRPGPHHRPGPSPRVPPPRAAPHDSMSLFELRAELDAAVGSEDYAVAAALRDAIADRELDARVAVEDANARFYRAFQSGRLGEMRKIWGTGDHVQCVHPGGEAVAGDALVMESWGMVLSGVSRGSFAIRLEDVRVVAGEGRGWVTCVEVVDSGGQEGRLVATNVFEVQEGRWVIVHHHASPSGVPALDV